MNWRRRLVSLKDTDLSVHSQAYLNKVARQLNERPREILQFETPARDLTPVLRRPVEPAAISGVWSRRMIWQSYRLRSKFPGYIARTVWRRFPSE